MKGLLKMKIILDIECGKTGKPYNIGYLIIKKNKIIKRRNIVILENIKDNQLSNCLTKILIDLRDKKGKFSYLTNKEFQKKFKQDLIRYNVKKVYAFNSPYDESKLNLICAGAHNLTFYDIRKLILPYLTDNFNFFCFTNNYLTKTGKPQTTLEVIYKYLTGDLNFNQEHTGLSDCLIEFELLKWIKKRDS